ncbi:MAG TPA: hypothetical protein VGQ44_15290 [Gemmatimonadaceae bacterium]|jgi:hypothetical protein|nr:hypothetical protein [Gemmatimonadaceae bacterium]
MLRQRLRGILRTTIVTAIPWTTLGFLIGMVFRFNLIPHVYITLGRPVPGGLVGALTLAGAIIGVINGLSLSGLVLATERNKKIEELRSWRFGVWGGIATAGTLGFVFQSSLVAAVGGVLGFGAGVAALAIARRAISPNDADALPNAQDARMVIR